MEKKPWYKSMTLWSAAFAAVGVLAPKYATVIPEVAGNVATIVGLVGSVVGRLRATKEVSFTQTEK